MEYDYATNGDIVKMMFSQYLFEVDEKEGKVILARLVPNGLLMERVIVTTFELKWWNAQYHSY